MDVLLEVNCLIRLAPPMRDLQVRDLLLILVTVNGKKDVVR